MAGGQFHSQPLVEKMTESRLDLQMAEFAVEMVACFGNPKNLVKGLALLVQKD